MRKIVSESYNLQFEGLKDKKKEEEEENVQPR